MLGLLKHKLNTQDFISQGIWRWPVINLVTLIDGYSHLISFEIFVGYWELRSFQETLINLNGSLENPDIMHPLRNSYNGISWAKLPNYSEDLGKCWKYSISMGTINVFKDQRGESLFMTGVENFFINWLGRHNLGPVRHFQQNNQPVKPPGTISPEDLDRVYQWSH